MVIISISIISSIAISVSLFSVLFSVLVLLLFSVNMLRNSVTITIIIASMPAFFLQHTLLRSALEHALVSVKALRR